ncbi:MAG: MFS transporter, partial [Verrucomicrobia bacterium]
TALANVSLPRVRATAFAVNILIVHLFGDIISPPLIGAIRDRWNMNVGFLTVSGAMLIAGTFWFLGTKFLPADTAAVERTASREQSSI